MITVNSETLKNVSVDFSGTNEELSVLINLLEFELTANPSKSGVGLAAIQINIPYRVAIIRYGKEKINLVNARIIKQEQPFIFKGEGCLSFPCIYIDTNRYNLIEVENGDGTILKFSGFMAVAVAHEIEHFNGEIFLDKAVNNG